MDPTTRAVGFASTRKRHFWTPMGERWPIPRRTDRAAAVIAGDNAGTAMKSVVVDPSVYDWESDVPLHTPSSQTIIYEMHVKGFTNTRLLG